MSWKDNVYFVLVETKESGNIGAASRAIKNMGFTKLVLINPADLTDEAYCMAWRSKDIIEKAEIYSNLDFALKDKSLVTGTTRRRGSKRGAIVDIKMELREFMMLLRIIKWPYCLEERIKDYLMKKLKDADIS